MDQMQSADPRPDPTLDLGTRYPAGLKSPLQHLLSGALNGTALVENDRRITYIQLQQSALLLAGDLRESGVEQGVVVAIIGRRSPELVVALLAILCAGGSFLILDPSYPAERLLNQIKVVTPRFLLPVSSRVGSMTAVLDSVRSINIGVLRPFHTLSVEGINRTSQSINLQDCLNPASLKRSGYFLFTSGTSGRPKAIYTDLAPLAHFLSWHSLKFNFKGKDRFGMLAGLAHDPVLRDIFTPLYIGASLYIPPSQAFTSPEVLLQWMRENRITTVHITPPLLRMICQQARRELETSGDGAILTALRYTFLGGDRLQFGDLDSWAQIAPNATCVNFYGTTETPQAVAYHVFSADESRATASRVDPAPIGKGIDASQLLILNPDLSLASVREIGEIYVRTPFLSDGYCGDDGTTKDKFVMNPFTRSESDRLYRTGDRGQYLNDGTVVLTGRADDQVKIRGFRVEPSEVASQITEICGVKDVCVLPSWRNGHGAELIAFVINREISLNRFDANLSAQDTIRPLLLARMPDYMVPRRIVALDSFPLTPNGKLDRAALLSYAEDPQCDNRADTKVGSAFERELLVCLRRWLPGSEITRDSDYLTLGGNSLMSVAIAIEFEHQTGVKVEPSLFFSKRTVANICEAITRHTFSNSAGSIVKEASSVPKQAEEILTRLRPVAERWRSLDRRSLPGKRDRMVYSMRESPYARVIAAALFRSKHRSVREFAAASILKLEGGAWFTRTLRLLYREYYDMDIGDYSSYCFSVSNFKHGTSFGRYCDITRTARFETANHPVNTISSHGIFYQKSLGFSSGVEIPRTRIVVGNDVHIGHNAIILYPTSVIGDGAVVAANAVVTSDVPPYAIVAGYPARVVRYRFPKEIIQELSEIRWWELPLEALSEIRGLFESPLVGDVIH
jgi:amino acid adenylation domain-containing protein